MSAKISSLMSCADGLCRKGCSHLYWKCDVCTCEGGWGVERERLEEMIKEEGKCQCLAVPTTSPNEISANVQRHLDVINAQFDEYEAPHRLALAELAEQRTAHLNNLASEVQAGRIK